MKNNRTPDLLIFGITDIADLLDGPNKKPFPESWPYTVQWLGNQPNRADIAKASSPLTPDQWQRAYAAIEKFPAANVPATKAPSSAGRP